MGLQPRNPKETTPKVAVFPFENGVKGEIVLTGDPDLGVSGQLDFQVNSRRGPGAFVQFAIIGLGLM